MEPLDISGVSTARAGKVTYPGSFTLITPLPLQRNTQHTTGLAQVVATAGFFSCLVIKAQSAQAASLCLRCHPEGAQKLARLCLFACLQVDVLDEHSDECEQRVQLSVS